MSDSDGDAEAAMAMFAKLDKNRSGSVSRRDVRAAFPDNEMDEQEAEALFDEMLGEGNDDVDAGRFLPLYKSFAHQPQLQSEEDRVKYEFLIAKFAEADADRNGTLGREELRVVFTNLGMELDENVFDRAFRDADLDDSGQIDLREFVGVFRQVVDELPISAQQLQTLQNNFRLASEGADTVTIQQLANLLDDRMILGEPSPVDQSLSNVLGRQIRAKNDTPLTFPDFVAFMKEFPNNMLTHEDDLPPRRARNTISDAQKHASLSRQELRQAFKQLGVNLDDEEVDELFEDADANNSGTIDLQEFLGLYSTALSRQDGEEDLVADAELRATFERIGGGESKISMSDIIADLDEREENDGDAELRFFLGGEIAKGNDAQCDFFLFRDLLQQFPGNSFLPEEKRQMERQKTMIGHRPALYHKLYKSVINKFARLDKDQSGELSQQELSGVFDDFGLSLNDAQIAELFDEVDTDGSGFVELPEFIEMYRSALEHTPLDSGTAEIIHDHFQQMTHGRDMVPMSTILLVLRQKMKEARHRSDADLEAYLEAHMERDPGDQLDFDQFTQLLRTFHNNSLMANVDSDSDSGSDDAMPKTVYGSAVEQFYLLDKDQSGTLSKEELRVAFEDMEVDISDAEFDQLFEGADVDQSGSVDLPEFLEIFKQALLILSLPQDMTERLQFLFNKVAHGRDKVGVGEMGAGIREFLKSSERRPMDGDLLSFMDHLVLTKPGLEWEFVDFVNAIKQFPCCSVVLSGSRNSGYVRDRLGGQSISLEEASPAVFHPELEDDFDELSQEEKRNFRTMFDYFDKDLDGTVTMSDLEVGFAKLMEDTGTQTSPEEMQFFFSAMNSSAALNKDVVTFKEFVMVLISVGNVDTLHRLISRESVLKHMERIILKKRRTNFRKALAVANSKITGVRVDERDLNDADINYPPELREPEQSDSDYDWVSVDEEEEAPHRSSNGNGVPQLSSSRLQPPEPEGFQDLDEEEKEEFRKVFQYFDEDAGGTISMTELYDGFMRMMDEAGHTPSESEMQFLFGIINQAGESGKEEVDFGGFVDSLLVLDEAGTFHGLLAHEGMRRIIGLAGDGAAAKDGGGVEHSRESMMRELANLNSDESEGDDEEEEEEEEEEDDDDEAQVERTHSAVQRELEGLDDDDDDEEDDEEDDEGGDRASLEEMFKRLDTDSDGLVSIADIARHINGGSSQVLQLLSGLSHLTGYRFHADLNLDPQRFATFVRVLGSYTAKANELAEDRLRMWCSRVFVEVDKSGLGKLTRADLRSTFASRNVVASNEMLDYLVESVRGEGDEADFEGFYAFMKSQVIAASPHGTLLSHPYFNFVHAETLRELGA